MAYDETYTIDYTITGEHDFGADADAVFWIKGPPGHQGSLKNIYVSTTEAFACTTTAANVQVGTSSDADAYGKLNIPDGSAINTLVDKADDTDAIIQPIIPADTEIKVSLIQSTDDSSDTGKGVVHVVIEWHD